jgi:hypothetical protein
MLYEGAMVSLSITPIRNVAPASKMRRPGRERLFDNSMRFEKAQDLKKVTRKEF